MKAVTITVPTNWLEELALEQEDLRQALMLGLQQLRQQRIAQDPRARVVQVLLSTGRVRHLAASLVKETGADRQTPPTLPGLPVSEILVAQRRGE